MHSDLLELLPPSISPIHEHLPPADAESVAGYEASRGRDASKQKVARGRNTIRHATPCHEKGASLLLPLTLPDTKRFSKFFHRQT